MQVGDLVKYIPYGHDQGSGDIGIITKINRVLGEYEVHFADGEVMSDLIFSELEVLDAR